LGKSSPHPGSFRPRKGRFPPGKRPFLVAAVLCLSLWAPGCTGREEPSPPGKVDPRVEGLRLLAFLEGGGGRVESFFLDRFEVTQGQFAAYLAHQGKRPPEPLRILWAGRKGPVPEKEDRPVTRVSPGQALSYAHWRGMRLPLSKEWEWAVGIRGAKKESFPWGEEFDRAHWDELKCNTAELGLGRPADVGTFELGATRGTRIYDLVGNVAEWVRLPLSPPPRGAGAGAGLEEEDPSASLGLRFSLEGAVWALPRRGLSWWKPLLPFLAPLGRAEWDRIRRPWAWMGWSYASRMERVGHTIPGRLSPRKGWNEWASTVGFRCAAWPVEILRWLLSREGPSLEGATGRAVERFLTRFRGVFLPLMGRGSIPEAEPSRRRRIERIL